MKKVLSLLSVPLLVVGLQANAATVSSESTLNSVSIATTGTATFDFNFDVADFFVADTIVNAGAASEVSDSAGDAFAVSASAASSGVTADAGIGHLSTTPSSSITSAIGGGDATASTTGEMEYTVSGTGSVTLTFAYSLYNDIFGTTGLGTEYTESVVTVSDSYGGFDENFLILDGIGGDFSDSINDVLTLTFEVDGWDSGLIYMDTYAFASTGVAPVPVPAAAWLFGSALVGIAGIARSKKKKA